MYRQRYRFVSRQAAHSLATQVLVLVLCTAWPAGPWPRLDAQDTGPRSGEWIQTSGADFALGESTGIEVQERGGGELALGSGASSGVYTSTVAQADFPFTAAALFWRPAVDPEPMPGPEVQVELRVHDGRAWSAWLPVEELQWVASRGAFYPEGPLLVMAGEAFQYRIHMRRLPDGTSPDLDAVGVVYIDASAGPTTAQARATAAGGEVEAQGVPKPAVIPRAGWGANESWMTWEPEYRAVEKIIVHHTATTNEYLDAGAAAGWVQAIYQYHAVTLGWGDIGYNYLIDHYGNIYEGRAGGPGVVAGHAYGYNSGSMGVSVIGTHTTAPLPAVSRAALIDIAAWEADRAAVHPTQSSFFRDKVTPNLAGHRDYNNTTCPGDVFYAELPGVRTEVWERVRAQGEAYDVLWSAWAPPAAPLATGETYATGVQVRNSGWMTWTQTGGGEAVSLLYRWLDGGGTEVVLPPGAVPAAPVSAQVAFGGAHTWNVQLTVPITPGTYTLEWDLTRADGTQFHTLNPDSPLLAQRIAAVDRFTVTGRLEDLYGMPLPGARVTASNGWGATADAAGTYTLALPVTDTYTLTACPSWAGEACALAIHNVGAVGETIPYTFALAPLGFHDLLTGGQAEAGLDGWAKSSAVVTSTAHTGLGGVALHAEGPGTSAWIAQSVHLPAGAAAPGVSLFYRLLSLSPGARFEVQVTGDAGTATFSLPLVEGWTHWHSSLPAGWEGDLSLSLSVTNGEGPAPAVVVVDEVAMGYQTGQVYLPLLAK